MRVRDELSGKWATCPACGESLMVPVSRRKPSSGAKRPASTPPPPPPKTYDSVEPFSSSFKLVALFAVLGVCGAIGYYFRIPNRDAGDPSGSTQPVRLTDAAASWKESYDAFLANIRPRKLGDRGQYEYGVGFGHLTLGEPFTWEVTLKEVNSETGPVFDVPPLPEPCSLTWKFAYRDVPRFRMLKSGQKVRITGRLTGAVQIADDPQTPESNLIGRPLPLSPQWNKNNDPNNWDLAQLPKQVSVIPTSVQFGLDISFIRLADPASVVIPEDVAALYVALDAAATRESGIFTTKPVPFQREFDVQKLDVAALTRVASDDPEVLKIVGSGKDLRDSAILLLGELGPKAQSAAPVIVARLKSRGGLGSLEYFEILDAIGATDEQTPLSEIWPTLEQELAISGDEEKNAALRG